MSSQGRNGRLRPLSPIVRGGRAAGAAAAFVLALLLPLAAQAAIGAAQAVVNHVEAHLPGQDRLLKPEDQVFQDEVIETAERSASKLLFRDATQMRIGPNSRVTLDKFVYSESSGQQVVVSMAVGVMRFTSGKLVKSAYTIRTPTATVGIRGTEFDVIVDENGATTIIVYSGEVLMRSQDGVSTSIGVCGVGMTSHEGQALTAQPIPANRLAPHQVSKVLEMDQLLEGSVRPVAAGVGDCLEPAGPGDGAPEGENNGAPLPFPPLPNFTPTLFQQQTQTPTPPAPPAPPPAQFASGLGGFGGGTPAPAPAFAPPPPSIIPGPGPGPADPPPPLPGGPGGGNGNAPGGSDPGGAPGGGGPTPPSTVFRYAGLAFDAQPNQANFGFTSLSLGGGATTHALAPIASPATAPIGQLSYDLVVANGGAIDNAGGLHGSRLEFHASTIDFVSTGPGGGAAALTITGGVLTLSYVDTGAFDYAEVDLPFGFGVADPVYALSGRLEFTLLDEDGTLLSGYWEILGTDRETGLPYNALSVGTQRDGGELDLAFFLRSLSSELECGGCAYEGLQLGLLFAGWGAPVPAPGGGWLLLAGGFVIALRLVRRGRSAR